MQRLEVIVRVMMYVTYPSLEEYSLSSGFSYSDFIKNAERKDASFYLLSNGLTRVLFFMHFLA